MEHKHILFWTTYTDNDKSLRDWIEKPIKLSPFHTLTLLSHTKIKNEVYLYTYHNIKESKVPKGITLMDANDILPNHVAFKALKKGHSIAHISDAVRLKVASALNGIVIDMDAVVLRKFPNVDSFYSSMPAKMTGGFAPKWGKSHPPLKVHDNSWDGKALCAFPLKVSNETSKHIESLSHKIMKNLLSEPNDWNYILWTIKKIIEIDTKGIVFPPIKCCPVPAWLRKDKCYSLESPTRLNGEVVLYGHKLPTIKSILEESYIVQHFFESAFSNSGMVSNDFWELIKTDCLLEKEVKKILGSDWRIEINK
tara:strand:- start:2522 stop:3448 length:927 start_codon:yes stop_codon:yes gene_type:complete